MGLVVLAAAILLVVAAVVLFLSDLAAVRSERLARAFDRTYEANLKARSKHW